MAGQKHPINKNLQTTSVLLILISGDISVNPGPTKYPCGVCSKVVKINQKGILCEDCLLWFHAQFSDSYFIDKTFSQNNDSVNESADVSDYLPSPASGVNKNNEHMEDIFDQLKDVRKKHPYQFLCAHININSLRKKVRNDISRLFPKLQPDDLLQIIPAKDEMTIAKIYTHSGESIVIYCVQKNPVFIEIFKELIPTVYTLWKFPEMVPVFRTYPPVFSKLKGGADLMLPGVYVEGGVTPSTFKHIQKGDLCCICLTGNKAPVAIGRAAMSGSDMFDSAMRGKGVQVLHMLGDELWNFGDKSDPPLIPDNISLQESTNDQENGETDNQNTGTDVMSSDLEKGQQGSSKNCDMNVENSELPITSDKNHENLLEKEVEQCTTELQDVHLQNGADNAEVQNGHDSLDINMDDLLDICFKCALKSSVKKSDIPLLTSAFFKNHMVKFCPEGKILDVKKSSYKKLSKFLQKMQKEGFVKVKELSKGVDSIVEFDKTLLRDFVPPYDIDSERSVSPQPEGEFVPPKLTEMYSVTAALVPLVKPSGYKKGGALTLADIRSCVGDYIKENNLQSEERKSQVQLDPILADIVLTKGENDVTHLSWEDLFKRVIGKMQPVLCIEYQGQPPIYQKGKVDGIRLDVLQRSGNKKITTIENVEIFGIDPKELAHSVQVGMACSAAITPLPQKNKGVQIVIQGNQIHFISDLLLNKYKVPRKYINGMEKAPKRR